MADITMTPKGTPDEHLQSSLKPRWKQSSKRARFSTTLRTLQLVAWIVSGKNFSQRDYLKKRSLLSHVQDDQVQSIIMNLPGESGIAGVVKVILIPFDVI